MDSIFRDPKSYFKKYAGLDDAQAEAARDIWTRINLRNPRENILAKDACPSLVLTKRPSHIIEEVELRKL